MLNPPLLVIIQARMGSSRLPGKVLREVNGKSILQLMLERLGIFGMPECAVVATSVLPADDLLVAACEKLGLPCFRGSESDVLARFYEAAKFFGAQAETVIIRICADSPLHHETVVDFALKQFHTHQLDYFSNAVPPKYEDGITTEVFRFSALERAHQEASLPSQREHVTPYIKESGEFLCGFQKFRAAYAWKLSVDTPDDFKLLHAVMTHFSPHAHFTIDEILTAFANHPDWEKINESSVLNEGYLKSLQEDQAHKK